MTVVRWRRYGHDRLYVNGADGQRIGWADLRERRIEAEAGVDPRMVEAAVHAHAAWLTAPDAEVATQSDPDVVAGGSDTPPAVEPATPTRGLRIEEAWTDLAANRPGQAARAQAVELRAQAPVRTMVARLLGARTEERAWRVGADGEQSVAKRLARLDDAWRVLHAVPVGSRGADIDHVVIGPGGVFTVNTKHHPGGDVWVGGDTVMINNAKVPYVRNARFEASRARDLLAAAVGTAVPVVGIVAVLCQKLTVKRAPASGVVVLAAEELTGWLGRLGPALDSAAAEAVYQRARRSTTWIQR